MSKDNIAVDLKVALVGPRRIGKTSLITAILAQGAKLLEDTPFTIEALDQATKAKIEKNEDLLHGSIFSGNFSAIPGDTDTTDYAIALRTRGVYPLLRAWTYTLDLLLDVGFPGVVFSIRDYPGHWSAARNREIDPTLVPKWDQYLRWVRESPILLIPIDAAILMEAKTPDERRCVPPLLQIAVVKDTATAWAKGRKEAKKKGLMILAPLRCESYFADNGGTTDRSRELRELCQGAYSIVISEALARAGDLISIEYHPIDTLGCVRFAEAKWEDLGPEPVMNPRFELRPPNRYSPRGADDLLCSIAGRFLGLWQEEREQIWTQLKRQFKEDGLIRILWNAGDILEKAIGLAEDGLNGKLMALIQVLKYLEARPCGKRVDKHFSSQSAEMVGAR